MSTMSTNIESHIVSILKRDVSEDQMMDSNSRLEGHIRQENLVGSTDAGEMCPSEARLQPVTGVPLSLCRIGDMCSSEAGMPPPRPTPRRVSPHKQGMRDQRPPGSFEIAIDAVKRGTGRVVKAFTSYPSPQDFFRETACMPKRNFYEIISDGNPCCLYFDVEHYSPSQFNEDGTPTDDFLALILATIRAEAQAYWQALAADPSPLDRVVVTTASRMVGGVWKHSYHIMYYAIGFRSNCGVLRAFARHLSSLDILQGKNAKMQPMSLIDTSVYSKDQNLRIIESWKYSENPSPEMALEFHPPRPHTMDALLQTLATNVQDVTHWIPEAQVADKSTKGPGGSGRKRVRSEKGAAQHQPRTAPTASTTDLPLCITRDVQELLDHNGSGCEVTGRVMPTRTPSDQILLPCRNQLSGPRQCLVTKGTTHGSNSAFCLVRGDYMWLKCHSEKCRGSRGVCLGKSPPSLLEWLHEAPGHEAPDSKRLKTALADASDRMDLDAVVRESTTAASSDVGRGMVEYEEALSTSAECPSYVETEAVSDTVEHEEAVESEAVRDMVTPDSPTPAFPRHNLTENDLIQLLDLLSTVSSPDHSLENLETVGPILKRFGYPESWNRWSAVNSLTQKHRDQMWSDYDAESCEKDLNDIVVMVNARLKASPSTGFGPCRPIEKIYFPRPSLSDKNNERITHTINEQYLAAEILDLPSRVVVIESCTGTGKTTSIIELARTLKMPIISICERITQVQQHVQAFRKAGIPTKQYDDPDVSQFQPGIDSLVTTIDSLPKIRRLLIDTEENAGKYIVLLDEIHSITGHILSSPTLRSTRKKAMLALSWLSAYGGKVVAMDNLITDVEFEFLDTLCDIAGACECAFIKNEYKKYTGTLVYYKDEEEMFAGMKEDIRKGNGFTAPCNTKKQAERIKRLLNTDDQTSNVKLYTSEEGTLPEDIDSEWSNASVVYSPTITTGIDFNPIEPQTVYLFLTREDTSSPAAALQMINRNRNIKDVCICAVKMKNQPEYASFEEMSTELDTLCHSTSASQGKAHDSRHADTRHIDTRHIDTLQHLQDSKIDLSTHTCSYSENEFSKLFKTARFHDNKMRSSFSHMLNGLLELRGFEIIQQPIVRRIAEVQKAEDWAAIDCLNEQDKEKEFTAWLAGIPTERTAYFERQLAALSRIKHSETNKHTTHLQGKRNQLRDLIEATPCNRPIYVKVFTDTRAFTHFMNLIHALYTNEKVRCDNTNNKSKDFAINNLDDTSSKARLMRKMISKFNSGIPLDSQLKPYDLTLKQSAYTEDEKLEISDDVWNLYKFLKKRNTTSRPTTRRALMTCIFVLSQDLFGKQFTTKTETSKSNARQDPGDSKVKRFNYITKETMLLAYIETTDWSRTELRNIEPEIVQRYNLEQRKEACVAAWWATSCDTSDGYTPTT